ncbi:unnamed protein product [Sphagnum jensenii]|uniref:Uncharacterized protein n=1 Tax=Sphagnum jensenii TaxID=128206 RepID=A0ABP1ASQ7_9BRYO
MVKEERRRRSRGPNRGLKIVVVPKAFEDLDAGGGKKAKAEEDTQEDDDHRGGRWRISSSSCFPPTFLDRSWFPFWVSVDLFTGSVHVNKFSCGGGL